MLTTDCKTFTSSVRVAIQACPARSPEETLQHVRLHCEPGLAYLEATDHIHVVRQEIPAAQADAAMSVLLPAKRVMSIVSQVDGQMSIQSKVDGECVIRCGKDRFRFLAPSVELYPKLSHRDNGTCFHAFEASRFLQALRSCIVSVDTKYGAFALGGVALDFSVDGPSFVVSTDGKRMSVVNVGGESHGGHSCDSASTVVPVHAVKSLIAAIENSSSQTVYVSSYASDVLFSSGGFTLVSRILDGRFPPWRKLMEKMKTGGLSVAKTTAKDLIAASRKIMVFDDPESLGAFFKFGNGRLVITKKDHADVEVPVEGAEEEAAVKLQPALLKDWLGTLSGDSEAVLRYAKGIRQVFVCSENSYFSVSTMEAVCV